MIMEHSACSRFGFTILGSGSQGNATVIHGPAGDLLLDAGFSAKELLHRMELRCVDPRQIRAVLLTHEHSDHVRGCRCFADKFSLPVYMTTPVCLFFRKKNAMPQHVVILEPGNSFEICGITVDPFAVAHDVDAVAYTFTCDGHKIGYATDLGSVTMLVTSKLSCCDALVLESNYDPRALVASHRPENLKRRIMSRHGHLSNENALETLQQVLAPQTHQVIFAHLSQECNDCVMVEEGLRRTLENMSRSDVFCCAARQDLPMETVWVSHGAETTLQRESCES